MKGIFMNREETGTKKEIMDVAIQLFANNGYENTSMRAIASAVDIKASSIYNHFNGKEELLDTIYQYYSKHYFYNQKPFEDCKAIIETGSKEEIFSCLVWSFYGMPPEMHTRMTAITKIVYMRFLRDPAANKIFTQHMLKDTIDMVNKKLSYAAALGRIEPGADIRTISEIITNTRLMVGISGLSQSSSGGIIDPKTHINTYLLNLIPFID